VRRSRLRRRLVNSRQCLRRPKATCSRGPPHAHPKHLCRICCPPS
jgi:hypothetical protein